MRPLLIGFLLGSVAVAITLLVAGFALAVAADVGGWTGFRVGVGPLVVLEFARTADGTSTTFGAGILGVAAGGGALNAIGAAYLSRRRI